MSGAAGMGSGDAAPVCIVRSEGYAEIVMNRPRQRNALSSAVIERLAKAFEEVERDERVQVVVVRGAQGFFCAGLDLKEINEPYPLAAEWIDLHERLAEIDTPIICALQGGAINAGAALALACDLIVVGDTAFLQIKEAEMGMTLPVNAALLALRYPAAVGLQLALSCRRYTGPELVRLTIALESVPDSEVLASARALAAQLASFPHNAGAATKRALRDARSEDVGRFLRAAKATSTLTGSVRQSPTAP